MPTRWKKITLKGNLSPDNGIDTDGDTLTDWEEVDTTKIKINTDNSIELHQKMEIYLLQLMNQIYYGKYSCES